jgi:mono/diheme cytochrome c family protein
MPSFEGTLSDEEIAQVAAFERLSFAGATLEQVTADCGLI